jgi:glutaconyl-CoA/methylmalonyl-CoA decarboxylase subunit gamma
LRVRFKVQIDGAEHEVEASAAGSVGLAGETFDAKVAKPSSDRRNVQVGDKTYEVRIIENCPETGIFVLEIAGERVPVTVSDVIKSAPVTVTASPDAAAAGGQGPAGAPVEVKHGVWAPVPGKIVNVMVKPGDKVDEGTAVVVLEAMKMENELHSPVKGTVTAVMVKKGDQAEKGQLLVAFE